MSVACKDSRKVSCRRVGFYTVALRTAASQQLDGTLVLRGHGRTPHWPSETSRLCWALQTYSKTTFKIKHICSLYACLIETVAAHHPLIMHTHTHTHPGTTRTWRNLEPASALTVTKMSQLQLTPQPPLTQTQAQASPQIMNRQMGVKPRQVAV